MNERHRPSAEGSSSDHFRPGMPEPRYVPDGAAADGRAADEPEFYYVPDMAVKLGLTEGGVRAMIRRGELPMFKAGRAYRMTPDRYRRWCREQEESQERARREGERVAGLIAHYWPRQRPKKKAPKRFPLPPTE